LSNEKRSSFKRFISGEPQIVMTFQNGSPNKGVKRSEARTLEPRSASSE
jgi:hypothetical protein